MWYIVIYSTEERSPDAGQKLVRNKRGIRKDYVWKHQVPFRNPTGW